MKQTLIIILVLNFNSCAGNSLTTEDALRFVQKVESQTTCVKVTYLDVLLDHRRWKKEALLVVEVANFMTSLWQKKNPSTNLSLAEDDDFIYRSVRSIVMFSAETFGSVICFDKNQYKNYYLFCPYAFKPPERNETVEVFDIAAQDGGYDYDNDENAIWWKDTKRKALTLNPATQFDYFSERFNATALRDKKEHRLPVVKYSDGVWTRPYYDCFGGKIWMVTFMAPIFNETSQFLGAVSIDIQLKNIDINQCDKEDEVEQNSHKSNPDQEETKLVEFLGTHHCKQSSTKCVHLPNQGFTRGSYTCNCKKGFYFPNPKAKIKHFNGLEVEASFDAMLEGRNSNYHKAFECMQCSPGCLECTDGSPCLYSENLAVRILLMCINAIFVVVAMVMGVVVLRYRDHKVIKASSPRFLFISIVGVVVMYATPYVTWTGLSKVQCQIKPWFHHMGFFLAYSSIIIKTWRVSVIFRVRSAQRVALTDTVLMRRLLLVIMSYVIYMLFWTNVSTIQVIKAKTSDGLIFERCSLPYWTEILAILGDFGLLTWGMWVCYQVRNAPSAYNESKFTSWAIYNTLFVTCFATILRFTIRNTTSPDYMYLLEFVFVHLTVTIMMVLIAFHKIIHIRKSKSSTSDILQTVHASFSCQSQPEETINTKDVPIVLEHEELRAEIERLSNRVEHLNSQLIQEKTKHVQNQTTTDPTSSGLMLGFGLTTSTNASISDIENPLNREISP